MLPLGLLAGALVAGSALAASRWRQHHRDQRRADLRARPLPDEWVDDLERNLEIYRRLPEDLRQELRGHVQVFLDEKKFEGCGGLEITDEIRVTVAGLACVLLLNRKTRYYPHLTAILVYPAAYVVETREQDRGMEAEATQVRLGESWEGGDLVLSWDDVLRSAADPKDGRNLVLHEFAHQLDQEDGRSDGVPPLGEDSLYDSWSEILSTEFFNLQRLAAKGRKDLLDAYGATNPAEFFAVATETFFERPLQMRRRHPELYDELSAYYRLDPASWGKGRPGREDDP